MIRERLLAIVIGAGFVLAACGGGAPTQAPGQTSGAGSTTGAGPTTGGAATQAPAPTSGGGGGGSGDACALLTTDEVHDATGFDNLTVQPIADDATDAVSGCSWISNGVLPIAIVTILDPENTNTDPAGYLSLPMSEEIPVNGARAVFAPAAGNVLFVIKNGTVVSVLITPQEGEPDSAARAVVQKVADRI